MQETRIQRRLKNYVLILIIAGSWPLGLGAIDTDPHPGGPSATETSTTQISVTGISILDTALEGLTTWFSSIAEPSFADAEDDTGVDPADPGDTSGVPDADATDMGFSIEPNG